MQDQTRDIWGARMAVALMLAVVAAFGLFAMGGCSDSEGNPGGCITSDDCPSSERCRFEGFDLRFDEFAAGFCAPFECFGGDCGPGQICRDGLCYLGNGGGGVNSTESQACQGDTDCPTGQRCDPVSQACVPETPAGCQTAADCGTNEICDEGSCVAEPVQCGGITCASGEVCENDVCVPPSGCITDFDCSTGERCTGGSCVPGGTGTTSGCQSQSDCPAGLACNRQTGDCIEVAGCDGVVCSGSTPILEPLTCSCVGCEVDADCRAEEFCTPNNRCLFEGRGSCNPPEQTCPAGQYCTLERCIDCVPGNAGDCAAGELCLRGRCGVCDCPDGLRCTTTGDCVPDIGLNDPCDSNNDCRERVRELDLDVENVEDVQCDPNVGCMVIGVCNSSISSDDPFDAACPQGTSCEAPGDLGLLGGLLGAGASVASCTGCDPNDASTCRQGETCSDGCAFGFGGICLVPDEGPPRCTGGDDGGGGFPFPF